MTIAEEQIRNWIRDNRDMYLGTVTIKAEVLEIALGALQQGPAWQDKAIEKMWLSLAASTVC